VLVRLCLLSRLPWHSKPQSMRILGYRRLATVISPAAVTLTLIGYAAESVVEIVVVDQLEPIAHLR
jgi:hypothetical protein